MTYTASVTHLADSVNQPDHPGHDPAPRAVPHYHAPFYDDAFIMDPFGHYAAMRALGPVVYLPDLGNFAVTRYQEVREALRHFEAFSSAQGVAADDAGCSFMSGAFTNTLNSDPPVHDQLRGAVAPPLFPGALDAIRPRIEAAAAGLVARLLAQGTFDGMADLARHLPLTIVTDLVGPSEHGRENMLQWAAASFDVLGIQNGRGRRGLETGREMRAYIAAEGRPDRLKPGSWTARLFDLADDGLSNGTEKGLWRSFGGGRPRARLRSPRPGQTPKPRGRSRS